MKLDPDEVLVGVPSDASLPAVCREALMSYATRPILRQAGVGVIYVVAKSRLSEIEQLAGTNALHVSQCCQTTFRLKPELRFLESVGGVCPNCLQETRFMKSCRTAAPR
jgi:hypothetical protein